MSSGSNYEVYKERKKKLLDSISSSCGQTMELVYNKCIKKKLIDPSNSGYIKD